jgi:hypothetical protein
MADKHRADLCADRDDVQDTVGQSRLVLSAQPPRASKARLAAATARSRSSASDSGTEPIVSPVFRGRIDERCGKWIGRGALALA